VFGRSRIRANTWERDKDGSEGMGMMKEWRDDDHQEGWAMGGRSFLVASLSALALSLCI
jgi:hypothetical protein